MKATYLAAMLFLWAGMASAQTTPVCEATGGSVCYYISPTGSDLGPGTYAAPWKSFANIMSYYQDSFKPAGWKSLNPGDYIYVLDGIHNTQVHSGDGTGPQGGSSCLAYFRFVSGAAGNPIHLKAYPGAKPIFDGFGSGICISQNSNWAVSGIEVRNAGGAGVDIDEATNVEIFGMFIHDNASQVVEGNPTGLMINMSGAVTVHHCTFQDNMEIPANIFPRGTGTHLFDNIGDVTLHDNVYANTKYVVAGAYVYPNSVASVDLGGVQSVLAGQQGTIIGGPVLNTYDIAWQINYDNGVSGWSVQRSLAANGGTFAVGARVAVITDISPTANPLCFNYKHAAISPTAQFIVYNNRFNNCGAINTGTQNIHFYHNLVTNGSAFVSADQGGTTHQDNILVEYNTFYNTGPLVVNPTIDYRSTDFPNDPSNIRFRNNIFYGGSQKVDIGQYMSDTLFNIAVPALGFSQNCYFSTGAPPVFSIGAANGGSYGVLGGDYSLSQWQSTYGWDVDSVITDPMFIDAAGGNFNLAAVSPCAAMGLFAGGSLSGPPTAALPPSAPKGIKVR